MPLKNQEETSLMIIETQPSVELKETLKLMPSELWVALKNVPLYPPEHPGLQQSFKDFTNLLNKLLVLRREVSISFIDGMIYLEGELAVEESLTFTELITLFTGLGVRVVI